LDPCCNQCIRNGTERRIYRSQDKTTVAQFSDEGTLAERIGTLVCGSRVLRMIDRNCKMMTAVTESEAMGLIPVTGITAVLPNVGDPIQPKEGDDGKIEYLSEILLEIEVRGLQSRISEIDFTDPDNPSLFFDDRFEVKLGARDDTIRKFGLFLSASQQLATGDMGVIDLSIDDKAHFIQH